MKVHFDYWLHDDKWHNIFPLKIYSYAINSAQLCREVLFISPDYMESVLNDNPYRINSVISNRSEKHSV
jgi:hypothetical protein